MKGLVIDDYFAISQEPRLASADKSASFACLQKSQKIYSHHKILGSAEKDVVGLRRSKVIGAELNAGDEAARNRIATLGSPVAKRLSLSWLTLQSVQLSHTTDACIYVFWGAGPRC